MARLAHFLRRAGVPARVPGPRLGGIPKRHISVLLRADVCGALPSFRAARGLHFVAASFRNRNHGAADLRRSGAGAAWRDAFGGGAAHHLFSTFPGAFGGGDDDRRPPAGAGIVVVDCQSRCVSSTTTAPATAAAAPPLPGTGAGRWVQQPPARPLSTGPSGDMKRTTTVDSFATAPRDGAADADAAAADSGGGGFFAAIGRFLSRDNIVAPPGYNRWLNVPASFLVQLSIGSVYAWSIFNEPLTRNLGVVASASADWGLTDVARQNIFCCCMRCCVALHRPWHTRIS